MTRHMVTIEVDTSCLPHYEDRYIAQLWHVAQANPAPWGTSEAGELARAIGYEIIRRWLAAAPVELYAHQPGDALRKARIDALPPDGVTAPDHQTASPSHADAGSTCWRCTQPATCKHNGFCSIERVDLEDLA